MQQGFCFVLRLLPGVVKPSNWYASEYLFSCVQGGEKTGNIHGNICFYVMGGNKKSGCLWDDVFYVLHGSLKEIVNSRLEKEASSSEKHLSYKPITLFRPQGF